MAERKRILLIDGHALAYRAYHALPPMTGPDGQPTNAVLGYATILLKAIQEQRPDYVVATFDAGETFRHREYPAYKATRAKTPDDLRAQFDHIQELTRRLGIPVIMVEGYEADDLLGTLAKRAQEEGLEAIIVTGDSDTFQLVDRHVKVLTPRRRFGDVHLYDEKAIQERYGLTPEQLIDLKALTGDSSDNIPGVRGIGIKTATRLLKQYGSLDEIYAHLDEIPPRWRKLLEQGREEAYRSRHLVQIVRDVDVDLDLKASRWGDYDRDQVMELLRQLGLHSLVRRIPKQRTPLGGEQLDLFGTQASAVEVAPQGPTGDYAAVTNAETLQAMIDALRQAERFGLDTETTGTNAMRAKLVGISLSDGPGRAWYIPVGHVQQAGGAGQLSLEAVQRALGPILADPQRIKVCHNAKFDLIILRRHGLPVEGPIYDTMLAAWLLSPSGRGIGLKEQVWQRLGIEMTPISQLIGKGRNQITMEYVGLDKVVPYACADADYTLRLLDILHEELVARKLWDLFTQVENPLVPVLCDMEMYGMVLDVAYLQTMSQVLAERLREIEAQIYELVGHPFNIRSTQQLGRVLFEELGLTGGRRTRTGYSTAAGVLEKLRDQHPVIPLVEEYRQLEKLKGTYVDALPQLVHPETGRVHTSFNQTGTSTGRLSSSDPNLQNIPVRTELGRKVRGAFVAPEGHVLLSCDYSQVELRLLAHLSGDPELTAAFHRDEDVHATTAAAILGIPLEAVTYEQRSLAKAINFGLMYGMSEYGLAARTNLSVEEARQFIDAYFTRFRKVRDYLDATIQKAHQEGYVETVLGRRRYFPELKSTSQAAASVRRAAERAAVNMPIQGSAADIIKLAMINLHRLLRERGLASAMILQVHDELVLEVPEAELDQVRELVVDTMSNAYRLNVPLKVDTAVGKNWMEMK